MKIKNMFILCGLLFVLFPVSCINDVGNYDYEDPAVTLPITVSDLQSGTVILGETLTIEPEVTITGDPSRYTYSWYVIERDFAGRLPEKIILGDTKNLNLPITLAVGGYDLSFVVADPARDIYVRKHAILNVTATEVGAGWFVLKDTDNETDFDYVKFSDDGTAFYSDLLLNPADPNSRLKGKAVKIEYQGSRYSNSTIVTGQSAYHILSEEDIKVYNAKDLSLFKNREEVFFIPPDTWRPQNILYTNTDLFLINDGKLFTIYGMMANVGKVIPKPGSYNFHSDMLSNNTGTALGFDLSTRTFYHLDAYSGPAALLSGTPPVANMDVTLVSLLSGKHAAPGLSMSIHAFALMKAPAEEKYYLLGLNYRNSNVYPVEQIAGVPVFDEIPSGSNLPTAAVKAAPWAGDFVYFANGNKLSVYKNASGLSGTDKEYQLHAFPADETVSYMVNLYHTEFNYLAVLTNNTAGNWKLYVFNVIGAGNPEFNTTPRYTQQGTGNARYLMYRHN
jgi:hypothetical protein